jgi:hypothetical protein
MPVAAAAARAPSKLVGQHQEIAAQQHGDLAGRPVGASLARDDADFSHSMRSPAWESYQVGPEAQLSARRPLSTGKVVGRN